MVVLDTDHITHLEQKLGAASRALRTRLDALDETEVATTIVSFEEQTRGWLSFLSRGRTLKAQIEAYRRLRRHLETYRSILVLDFDERAAVEFQKLRSLHLRVGTMDLKIAAIVLANGASLLSNNLRDFHQVPNLKVESWIS